MTHQITVAEIAVDIVRKDIKNLHLGVYPPDGRVRVAAPLMLDDDAVRMAVISKLSWIRKQITSFTGQARQSPREFLPRESHYFLGDRYLLMITETKGKTGVTLKNSSTLEILIRPGSSPARREAILTAWYRSELKRIIPGMIGKWEPILAVQVSGWGVRKMKTTWGSCNPASHRILLNLELVKKPLPCIEYIILHEMLHLIERRHNDTFHELLTQHMPKWRLIRDELNAAPLAHETWKKE